MATTKNRRGREMRSMREYAQGCFETDTDIHSVSIRLVSSTQSRGFVRHTCVIGNQFLNKLRRRREKKQHRRSSVPSPVLHIRHIHVHHQRTNVHAASFGLAGDRVEAHARAWLQGRDGQGPIARQVHRVSHQHRAQEHLAASRRRMLVLVAVGCVASKVRAPPCQRKGWTEA